MYVIEEQCWQIQERPAYRVITQGVQSLSDRELVGSIIGSQSLAATIFDQYQDISTLAKASLSDLLLVPGMDTDRATRLLAAFALGRRKQSHHLKPIRFTDSSQVAAFVGPHYGDYDREVFAVLYLRRNLSLIAHEVVFTGGVSATIIDVKVVLKRALSYVASALVLVHNHPSGNLRASEADLSITKKIKEAANLFDIMIVDHVIVTQCGYYSMVDAGDM